MPYLERWKKHRISGKNEIDFGTLRDFEVTLKIKASDAEEVEQLLEDGFDSSMLFEDKAVFQPEIIRIRNLAGTEGDH